jgi:hypothetical protein
VCKAVGTAVNPAEWAREAGGKAVGAAAQTPGTAAQTPGTAAQTPGAAAQTPGTAAQTPGTAARAPAGQTSGLAVASLALGVLGLISCMPPVGVVGLILGIMALRKMQRNPEITGKGFGIAGLVLGGICALLTLLLLIGIAAAIIMPLLEQ